MLNRRITVYIYISLSLIPLLIFSFFGFYSNSDVFLQIDTLAFCSFFFSTIILLSYCHRIIFSAILVSFLTVIALFTSISREYLDFYELYISFDSLKLYRELFLAIKNFNSTPAIILISVLCSLGLVLYKLLFKKLSDLSLKAGVIAFTVPLFLGFFLAHVHSSRNDSVKLLNLNENTSRETELENPVMYFFRSTPIAGLFSPDSQSTSQETKAKIVAKALKKKTLVALPQEYSGNNFGALILNYPGLSYKQSPTDPLAFSPVKQKHATPLYLKNILLIVLESTRFQELSNEVTPNLLKIAAESFWYTNHYATSRATIKSEQAILCSSIDGNLLTPFARIEGIYRGKCLPHILKNYDYSTSWFHGNTKEFYNREVFHPSLGFDKVYSKESFEAEGYNSEKDIGWGVSDPTLYDTVFSYMDLQKKPFFAEALTLSSHQPFDWDYKGFEFPAHIQKLEDDIYGNYQRSLYYADAALGNFWKEFKTKSYYRDTIVVITGDHGVPFYPESIGSARKKFDTLFKVPLLIHVPGSKPQTFNASRSHLDIAPTILSLLNIKEENSFLGRPLLGQDVSNDKRPIFLMNMENYGFIYGESKCFPNVKMCSHNESCLNEKRFSCAINSEEDLEAIAQSSDFMKYLRLKTLAGFSES